MNRRDNLTGETTMICPICKTNNTANAKTCWSCGNELPKQESIETSEKPSASHWNSNAKPSSLSSAPVQNVNLENDFLMGFLLGPIGIICATIIDKRSGFWAAFLGAAFLALGVGLIFLIALTK